ncbi:MAG: recombinase family protein [Clostridia bacterium]|nr:recombinase family protein [Clostridia bacterium]
MNPKVAIYCRLSEEDKNKRNDTDDSESIQNQKNMLIEHAWKNHWEIYDIYSDDDYAGADRNRPAFKRLISDAQVRKFNVVLCKTQSRFTRELELVEKYIHGLFPLWGIRFVSIVDNADTDNKGNKKSRQINGLVNEWYLEDMSENIRSVLESKQRQGLHIGSFALYGYKKDPDRKGHLIIDDVAAEVVREVFSLYDQGYGRTAIARMLNERGIPNPTEYKRLCGLRYQPAKTKNSTMWRYPAISSMLSNQMYIGNMVQGRSGSVSYKTKEIKPRPKSDWHIVEGTHEPIIERDLWDRVQIKLSERAKPFITGTVGLFAGKAVCGECGYVMRSSKNHGRYYLQCATRHVSQGACNGCFIPVNTLEQIVIGELNKITDQYLNLDELERNIEFSATLTKQKTALAASLTSLEKSHDQLSKGVRDLYIDKVKGLISESDFVAISCDIKKDIRRVEQEMVAVKKQIEDLDARIQAGDDRKKIIQKHIYPEHLTREMTEELIDKVIITRNPCNKKEIGINICWKF